MLKYNTDGGFPTPSKMKELVFTKYCTNKTQEAAYGIVLLKYLEIAGVLLFALLKCMCGCKGEFVSKIKGALKTLWLMYF